jgi:hypothetical protein
MDTLRMLAENTDGRAIVNRNDIAVGMKQITRDSSAYYLIGYNSTQAPTDGKFHNIRVRVKRPGVQVRAQEGLLGAHAAGRGPRAGAAKAGPAEAGGSGAQRGHRAAVARERRSHLDRDLARRQRQDARDLRLGAAAEAARGPSS